MSRWTRALSGHWPGALRFWLEGPGQASEKGREGRFDREETCTGLQGADVMALVPLDRPIPGTRFRHRERERGVDATAGSTSQMSQGHCLLLCLASNGLKRQASR